MLTMLPFNKLKSFCKQSYFDTLLIFLRHLQVFIEKMDGDEDDDEEKEEEKEKEKVNKKELLVIF